MGGWHAFPGGGLSRVRRRAPRLRRAPARLGRSRRPRAFPNRCATWTSRARTSSPGSPPAPCASCSRRPASSSPRPAVDPEELPEPRRALLAGERTFADILQTLECEARRLAPGLRRPLGDAAVRAGPLRQPLLPPRMAGRTAPAEPSVHEGELEHGAWVDPRRGLGGLAPRRRAGGAADPPHPGGPEPGRPDPRPRPPARSRPRPTSAPCAGSRCAPGWSCSRSSPTRCRPAATTNAYLLGTRDVRAGGPRRLVRPRARPPGGRPGRRPRAARPQGHRHLAHPSPSGPRGRRRAPAGLPRRARPRPSADRRARWPAGGSRSTASSRTASGSSSAAAAGTSPSSSSTPLGTPGGTSASWRRSSARSSAATWSRG